MNKQREQLLTQMHRFLRLTDNCGLQGHERLKLLVIDTLIALGCQTSAKSNEFSAFCKLPNEAGKDAVHYIVAPTAGVHLKCNSVFRAPDCRRMDQIDPKWRVVGSVANWSRRCTRSISLEIKEFL